MAESLIETHSLLIFDQGTFLPAWLEEAVPFWKERPNLTQYLTLTDVNIFESISWKVFVFILMQ